MVGKFPILVHSVCACEKRRTGACGELMAKLNEKQSEMRSSLVCDTNLVVKKRKQNGLSHFEGYFFR